MNDSLYFAPNDPGDALTILSEHAGRVVVLAGGTDLVPKINYYELKPEALLYIGGLGLDYIKEQNGKLIIGAAATWTAIAANPLIQEKAKVLSTAARQGATLAVRNAATIGGNIANASPAGDLIPPLMVLDAQLLLKRAGEERMTPVAEFFSGPGETALKSDEMIFEIHVPFQQGNAFFQKLGRRKAMTHSVASATVRLEMNKGVCDDARIVLGSMASTPLRCAQAEKLIKGKAVDAKIIAECANEAVAASSPITDQRASAWYRKRAGGAIMTRALSQAAGVTN